MTREEIENGFVKAGWKMYHSSEGLLVGNSGDLSILAAELEPEPDDPVFELCDGAHGTTYWVRVIPTPRMAAVLIKKHGEEPKEERGNPSSKVSSGRSFSRGLPPALCVAIFVGQLVRA